MNELQEHQGGIEPKRPKAKKILTILAISLLILLPTILAVVLTVFSELHEDPSGFEGVEVVLYDADKNELFRESGNNINNETDSLVKILCAIDDNRQKYGAADKTPTDTAPLIASISRNGSVTELTCYFSFYSGQSWCSDATGAQYLIPDVYSEYFINSIFAEPLYAASQSPTLISFDGSQILSKKTIWNYRNESGQWLKSLLTKTASGLQTHDSTGGISLSFSEAPTSCVVTLYEQNVLIYTGNIEGISSVPLSQSTVRIVITASWEKTDFGTYYGEQTYDFLMRIHNKADFTISSTEISANHPVLICATNVKNLSLLTFSSEDISFKPEFHLRGTTAFALIPYPSDADGKQLKNISFTLSYGVSEQTFELTYNEQSAEISTEVCALLGIHPEYFNTTIDNIFLGGKHTEPDSSKFVLEHAFGDNISFKNTQVTSPMAIYLSKDGHGNALKSCYAGKVAFVGSNETLGNYVIIDLGLDIKLWYCFLSETYVRQGDIIATDEIIGTTGSVEIGANGADGFGVIFSFRDLVIAPNFIYNIDLAY